MGGIYSRIAVKRVSGAMETARSGFYLKQLVQFFLYSNLHIPVIALALISSTSVVFNIEFSVALALVSCTGTFVVYQFDRVFLRSPEDGINQPERVNWYREHPIYTYVSMCLGVVIGGIATFYLSTKTVWFGASLGLFGVLYLVPYGSHQVRLKGHWLVKPLYITLCWTCGGVILPLIESGWKIDNLVWYFFLYRSLLIFANVILSDLPDQRGDRVARLNTLATLISKKNLIQLVIGLALLSLFIGIIQGIHYNWSFVLYLDLLGAAFMVGLAYVAGQEDRSNSHFLFSYVNDLIIGWPLVIVVVFLIVESSV